MLARKQRNAHSSVEVATATPRKGPRYTYAMAPYQDDPTHGDLSRTRTIYFIRHGEAYHNILEKKAKAKARDDATAEGLAPDCEETLRRVDEARKGVLSDESLLDAPLSDMGEIEAQGARTSIERIVKEKGLPPPTEVLVSPLQRAIQTADIVFPAHDNIHVREEVRERLTGRACDTRRPSIEVVKQPSFRRFSSNSRLMESFLESDNSDGEDEKKGEVEDKYQLRKRTRKLFDLIAESDHKVLAVVTHKAFLRELERGPFGNAAATEFANCEVRVYQASPFEAGARLVETAKRVA